MAKRNIAPKPKEQEVVEQKVDEPVVIDQEQISETPKVVEQEDMESEPLEQGEQELNDTTDVLEDKATTPPVTETKPETKPEVKPKEVVQHIVTLGTVQHSGKVYQVGDKINLPKGDLQRLIDLGVVKQV